MPLYKFFIEFLPLK